MSRKKISASAREGKHHMLTHLMHVDPKLAGEQILDALRRGGMNRGEAAGLLRCGYSTLLRWIEDLQLDAAIERMTQQALREGWYRGPARKIVVGGEERVVGVTGGRPRGLEWSPEERASRARARAKRPSKKKRRQGAGASR